MTSKKFTMLCWTFGCSHSLKKESKDSFQFQSSVSSNPCAKSFKKSADKKSPESHSWSSKISNLIILVLNSWLTANSLKSSTLCWRATSKITNWLKTSNLSELSSKTTSKSSVHSTNIAKKSTQKCSNGHQSTLKDSGPKIKTHSKSTTTTWSSKFCFYLENSNHFWKAREH